MDQGELRRIYLGHQKQGCFLRWDEWKENVERAYSELIERAKNIPYNQFTITYGELGSRIGLFPLSDWFHLKIGWIVGACSEYEYQQSSPLISALVVSLETNQPGKGFWGLPGIPPHLRKAAKIEDTTPFQIKGDRDKFWVEELKRIDKFWKRGEEGRPMQPKAEEVKMTDKQLFDEVLSGALVQTEEYVQDAKILTKRFQDVQEGIINFLGENANVVPIIRKYQYDTRLYLQIWENYHITLKTSLLNTLKAAAGCFIGALLILGTEFITGSVVLAINLTDLVKTLLKNFYALSEEEQKLWYAVASCRKKRYKKDKTYYPSTRDIVNELAIQPTKSNLSQISHALESLAERGLLTKPAKQKWWLAW